jgi:hypothetical protein
VGYVSARCWQALERVIDVICGELVGEGLWRYNILPVRVGSSEPCIDRERVAQIPKGLAKYVERKLLEDETGLVLCRSIEVIDDEERMREYIIYPPLSPWGIGVMIIVRQLGFAKSSQEACAYIKKELIEMAKKSSPFKKWLQSPKCDEQRALERLRSEIKTIASLMSEEQRKRLAEELRKIAEELLK